MKKIQTILCGALAVLALTACSNDNDEVFDGNKSRTYTVTTEASMGGEPQKALALDGAGGITGTFATTEDVYVYNASNGNALLDGSLKPQADGASVTLKGTLTGTIANGNTLTLVYPQSTINYTGQNGLLTGTNSIAEKYDFAKATVTVSDASTANITTTSATFEPLQAITKFTFNVAVKSLTISGTGLVQSVAADGTVTNGDIDVTLATPSSTVYVAMSNTSGAKQTYTFTAIDADDNEYTGTKSAKLQNGKNYTAEVTLSPVGPRAFDLGLSVKWANMNVGAESETDYGLFFAWGETTGYSSASTSDGRSFNWTNYQLCNGSNTTLKKYNNNYSYGTVDNKKTLEAADDAAKAVMGSGWRMPTYAELNELVGTKSNTTDYTWAWQTNYKGSGHNGWLITYNVNDNSIFLPTAGWRDNASLYYQGTYGNYWSSSVKESDARSAHILYFDSGSASMSSGSIRYDGLPVRAVQD